jgi:quinol monooxygenase YgiN
MLINAVTYTFPSESVADAERMLVELRDASRAEAGCGGFDVSRANDDPHVFVLHERWNDAAALDAHYKTEHFQRLGVNGIRSIAKTRVGYLCTPLEE